MIGCPVNHGPRGGVSTPPSDCALGTLVQRFYWLANRSHVFSDLGPPIKNDPEKGIGRLKAGSTYRRLEALATLFATTAALPRVLNLTVHTIINLLKIDSRLTVIASELITSYSELKPLVVVVVVDEFFV